MDHHHHSYITGEGKEEAACVNFRGENVPCATHVGGAFFFFTISFLFFFLYLVFPFLGEHIPLSLKKHNHPLHRIILIIMHFLSKEELHFVILINDGPADLSCSDPSVEYIADQEDCGRYFRSFRSYVASTHPTLWGTYMHRLDH